MFPGEADVLAVQEAVSDLFEYLVARHRDGLLKTDFKPPLGKVSYHVPGHGRVQKIGRKTEEMFKLIGQTVAGSSTRWSAAPAMPAPMALRHRPTRWR